MSPKSRSVRGLLAMAAFWGLASCDTNMPGGAVPPGVDAFTISNQLFEIALGVSGQFVIQANSPPVRKAAAIPLFSEVPADRPAVAALAIDLNRVSAVPLDLAKGRLAQQTLNGSAECVVYIGEEGTDNACEDGTRVGAFRFVFSNGVVSIEDASLDLPAAALEAVITGSFKICFEVSATVDVVLTIEEIGVSFGPPVEMPGNGNLNANGNVNDNGNANGNANINGNVNDNGVDCLMDEDCATEQACVAGVCVDMMDGNGNDNGSAGAIVQIPIDSLGLPIDPNADVDGVAYTFDSPPESSGVMEVTSPDATPARWPSTISVDLGALGMESVEKAYWATFTSFAPDLPSGTTVASLTFEYVEGGDPTVVSFSVGSNTAEWALERPELLDSLGALGHSAPAAIFEFPSTLGSASTYTGRYIGGSVALDATRTLSCLKLELDPGSPFVSLRNPANATSTWLAQTMYAITLEGPEGIPPVSGVDCTPVADPLAGFVEANPTHEGSEHLIAGPDVDPSVSVVYPAGYGPRDIALSGDGQVVWAVLFDQFPDVEGDPQVQIWSFATDGATGQRSSVNSEDANVGSDGRFYGWVSTNLDGSVAVADASDGLFGRATPGAAVTTFVDSLQIQDAGFCARGIHRVTDDGSTMLFSSFCDVAVHSVPIGTSLTTPSVLAPKSAFSIDGLTFQVGLFFEFDMSSTGSVWTTVPSVFDSSENRARVDVVVGTGGSPVQQNVPNLGESIANLNMTDDGSTIGYCPQGSAFEVGACYIQSVGGSSSRVEITDGKTRMGDLSLADDGSRAYLRTSFGFGLSSGEGLFYDVASGTLRLGGSQRFADSATANFAPAELSDDGSVLAAGVTRGVYIMRDGSSPPAGFPTIDRILYKIDDELCTMTVRVEVTAPLGVERIFTLPLFMGQEPLSQLDGEQDPLFRERSGGGVNLSTIFTQVENNAWEREIILTNGVGACASNLLDDRFEIRIVLIEATGSRGVYKDFRPVP